MRPHSTSPGRSATPARSISRSTGRSRQSTTSTPSRSTPTGRHVSTRSQIIGYSAAAGAVLVVLAYRDLDGDLHGMTAWPAAGRALRLYTDGRRSEERRVG